jgi:hypothetical protein
VNPNKSYKGLENPGDRTGEEKKRRRGEERKE